MFYEAIISRTVKTGRDDYHVYGQTRKTFNTKQDVAKYLGQEYYYVKTTIPSYNDNYQGKCGTIYCWKERDNGKTVYCQDWVSVYDTVRKPVIVNRDRR